MPHPGPRLWGSVTAVPPSLYDCCCCCRRDRRVRRAHCSHWMAGRELLLGELAWVVRRSMPLVRQHWTSRRCGRFDWAVPLLSAFVGVGGGRRGLDGGA